MEDEDMAHVHFTADFDYCPTDRSTTAYKAGWSGSVKRDCADQAIAAGKAEPVETPRSANAPAAPAVDEHDGAAEE